MKNKCVVVGVNFLDLVRGKVGGVEKYMINLARWLPLVCKSGKFVFFLPNDSEDLFEFAKTYKNVRLVELPRWDDKTREVILPQLINAMDIDYWHCPLNRLDPVTCPVASGVVVLDLQHKYFPDFFGEVELASRESRMRDVETKADVVIAISDSTRRDLLLHYDLQPDRVKKIYIAAANGFEELEGVGVKKISEVISEYGLLPKNYLLYSANFLTVSGES